MQLGWPIIASGPSGIEVRELYLAALAVTYGSNKAVEERFRMIGKLVE